MKKFIVTVILVLLLPLGASAYSITYPPGYVSYHNEGNAVLLAKMLYGEGGANTNEHSAACWVAVNRVEAGYGNIEHVITARGQFVGYNKSNPVTDYYYAVAVDVLIRWDMERCGYEDVGRVLPLEYMWFAGKNGSNYFRDAYRGGNTWDWSLASPYDDWEG